VGRRATSPTFARPGRRRRAAGGATRDRARVGRAQLPRAGRGSRLARACRYLARRRAARAGARNARVHARVARPEPGARPEHREHDPRAGHPGRARSEPSTAR
jgi:hypothetical protein